MDWKEFSGFQIKEDNVNEHKVKDCRHRFWITLTA